MSLKTFNRAGLAVSIGAALCFSQLSMGAADGIIHTPHNLSSTSASAGAFGASTGPVRSWSGTAEICVFCHTPHGSSTTAVVPLWNRNLDATPAATYTTYDDLGTSSLDGAVAAVGSVSIACLSCHDGQQAMDTMINEPGSGLDTITNVSETWTTGDKPTGIANLGTDLTSDHPVGIVYAGGLASGSDWNAPATFNDPDFFGAHEATINGKKVWWIDDGDTNREKNEMQLYTRTDALASDGVATLTGTFPYVECASCHDPHTSANKTFLRKNNDGSAVCLSCHNK